MKAIYQKPETTATQVNTNQLMDASPMSISIGSGTASSGDAKAYNWYNDEEDEEAW